MKDAGSIAECIELAFKDDPKYMLGHLKDLYESTGDELFNERIEKICRKNELCIDCFNDLIITEEHEVIGEYMGVPAMETIHKRTCSRCGKEI